jgi:hypothetical protein
VKSTRVQANLIDELTAQTRKILESLDGAPSLSELARLWNERRKPFWRITPGLYRKFCAVVLNRGENLFAIEIADEGLRCAPNEYALEYFRALALARVGNFGAAERILAERPSLMAEVSDAPSLVGRVYKDYWKQTGDKSFLRVALDAYRQAYEKVNVSNSPAERTAFPAVNAATVALLLDLSDQARIWAERVIDLFRRASESYEARILSRLGQQEEKYDLVKRLSSDRKLSPYFADLDRDARYWTLASLGEASLVLGDLEAARLYYRSARVPETPLAYVATSRTQARLLLGKLGFNRDEFEAIFELAKIGVFSGHMVDAEDRLNPRFPAERSDLVSTKLKRLIGEHRIGIGFCGAAAGADLLFAKGLMEARGELHLVLPYRPDRFLELSVANYGKEWTARFDEVLRYASAVDVAFSNNILSADAQYQLANCILLASANAKAQEIETELIGIAVWDGECSGRTGGTSDFVVLANKMGLKMEIVSPCPDFGGTLPAKIDLAFRVIPKEIAFCLAAKLGYDDFLAAMHAARYDENLPEALWLQEEEGWCLWGGMRLESIFLVLEQFERANLHPGLGIACSVDGMTLGFHLRPRLNRSLVARAKDLAMLEPSQFVYVSSEVASLFPFVTSIPKLKGKFVGRRQLGFSWDPVFQCVWKQTPSEDLSTDESRAGIEVSFP